MAHDLVTELLQYSSLACFMAIWQLCANLLIPNCLRSNLSYSPLAALELYVNYSKSKSSSSEEQNLNKPKFKEGDLVVEKSTQKQLRLGNFYNNSWVCLSNGQEYKNLKEHDLYTWDEYLASIGKK